MNIDEIISKIITIEPETKLSPISLGDIKKYEDRFPGMPKELKDLYSLRGEGCIGDSRYMIHFFLDPKDIYDLETAEKLNGILIVGDDFAGNCEAYDASNGWEFGSIGYDGVFEKYESIYTSFNDFLVTWFLKEE